MTSEDEKTRREAKKAYQALKDEDFDIEVRTGKGIPHSVLNARQHEQEAYIVADAGLPGVVTIATNMAGRGTDIQLGGNLDMRVKAALTGSETPEQIEALRRQIAVDVE